MIHTWNVTIPALSGDRPRRGYVYLPEDYETSQAHYPVLYMFDGHNVFFDDHATYGKSWGMADYMEKARLPLIIVAIECNDQGFQRLNEYTPFPFDYKGMHFESRGKIYMDWLVNELKPAIDRALPTLPGADHTYIAGSSMGGLMSLYAVSTYNHIFHGAACLSPSVWTDADAVDAMLDGAAFAPSTNIYLDYGNDELYNHSDILPGDGTVLPILERTCVHLLEKGVNLSFRLIPGGTHCEASWEKQIPIFLACLGLAK